MLWLAVFRVEEADAFMKGKFLKIPAGVGDFLDEALLLVWKQEPDNEEVVKVLGIRLSAQGDLSVKALDVYEKCYDLDLGIPAALQLLAEHYETTGSHEKAIDVFTQLFGCGGEIGKSAAVKLCQLWDQTDGFGDVNVLLVAYNESPSDMAVQRFIITFLSNTESYDAKTIQLFDRVLCDQNMDAYMLSAIERYLKHTTKWNDKEIKMAYRSLSKGAESAELAELKERFVHTIGQRLWNEVATDSAVNTLLEEGGSTDD
jgi:hypothetical protein